MDLYPANSLGTTPINPISPVNTINSGFITDLQQTSGMAGAKSIVTRPSTRISVFDSNDDVFYIISTDVNNNKTIGRYRFFAEDEPKPEDIFASKAEIKELKGEINDVQQSIRELTNAITNAFNSSSSASNSDVQFDTGSTNGNKKFVSKPKGESKPNGAYASSNG